MIPKLLSPEHYDRLLAVLHDLRRLHDEIPVAVDLPDAVHQILCLVEDAQVEAESIPVGVMPGEAG